MTKRTGSYEYRMEAQAAASDCPARPNSPSSAVHSASDGEQ